MSKEVKLLRHNEEAYKRLINKLKETNYCTINHATGTGKSFIVLKYLYENRDKRILYLSPSYNINDQLLNEHMEDLGISKDEFKKIDSTIYTNLLNKDMKQLSKQYDIIILDEYHRCGATEWGKKVSELMSYYKNKPGKTVIGTSATETRYLDNNKNMKDILFDGHQASKLTLADAMLMGILPAPKYINYANNLESAINKILKRISRLCVYKEDLDKYTSIIISLKKQLDLIMYNNYYLKDHLQGKSKFLVFETKINDYKDDSKFISELFDNAPIQNYRINSKMSKEENAKEIKRFREATRDEISILYSVNKLNEGVHIKDVDGIFMLRETTSPIIYFQQLGRLLSYSKRKDQVLVCDMVNNLSHHHVIYSLYQEVVKKAEILKKLHPEYADRYDDIVSKFQIINESSNLIEKIAKLDEITKEKDLIDDRINTAIKKLNNEPVGSADYIQAIMDIFKFQNYITRQQFVEISKLNIKKPSLFNHSYEEFDLFLGDKLNIREVVSTNNSSLISKVKSFYRKEFRLPSIKSNDIEEQHLATMLLLNYDVISSSFQDYVSNHTENTMTLVERLTYGCFIRREDFETICNEVEYMIENHIPINLSIYDYLIDSNMDRARKLIEVINEKHLFTEIKISTNLIDTAEDTKTLYEEYNLSAANLFNTKTMNLVKTYREEYILTSDKPGYLTNIFNDVFKYLEDNMEMPSLFNDGKALRIKYDTFAKELTKVGYVDLIREKEKKVLEQKAILKKKRFIEKLSEFIKGNGGLFPTDKSLNEAEKNLAIELKKYMLDEDIIELISNYTSKKDFELRRQGVVNNYASFCLKHKRIPILNQEDEEEYNIALEFERIKKYLTKDEIIKIKRAAGHKSNQASIIYQEIEAKKGK